MDLELKAKNRTVLGKKVAQLRRDGQIPANLFGPKRESRPLQIAARDAQALLRHAGSNSLVMLEIEGEKEMTQVMLSEVQIKPTSQELLHLNLYAVDLSHKMRAEVPVVWVGESPASKATNRMLLAILSHLTVECLPSEIPPHFEVDVTELDDPDDQIKVGEMDLGGIEVLDDPDEIVVRVVISRGGVAEGVEEGAEGEEGEGLEEGAEGAAVEGEEAQAGEGAGKAESK